MLLVSFICNAKEFLEDVLHSSSLRGAVPGWLRKM